MAGAAVLGVIIERVAIAPLREADPYSAFLSSLGIGTVLPVLAQKIWGVSTQPFPAHIEFKTFHFGDISINTMQIVIIGAAVFLVVALYLFVQKTAMGMAMRSSSYSVTLSKLMGVNVDAVIRATFAISSALAGAGGVLVAAYYDAIFPTMGFVVALKAFTAAVVGGIGSIPGTILGGLLIGLLEAIASGFISSRFQDAIAFIILVLMLLFKPTGLMGRDVVQKM
jgi:branched-chain amino acid transport system permease protein